MWWVLVRPQQQGRPPQLQAVQEQQPQVQRRLERQRRQRQGLTPLLPLQKLRVPQLGRRWLRLQRWCWWLAWLPPMQRVVLRCWRRLLLPHAGLAAGPGWLRRRQRARQAGHRPLPPLRAPGLLSRCCCREAGPWEARLA